MTNPRDSRQRVRLRAIQRARRMRHEHGLLGRLVRWHEFPLLVGLTVLWMLLWREFSWLSLLSGLVVAVGVMRSFYLPPVELAGRFNPLWAVAAVGYLLWNLAAASAQVMWVALRPKAPPVSGIIEVRLRTSSDFLLTLTALALSLIPGSMVVEVDRYGSRLYLHLLDAERPGAAEKCRRQVLRLEELVTLSLGSRDAVEEVRGR